MARGRPAIYVFVEELWEKVSKQQKQVYFFQMSFLRLAKITDSLEYYI